MWIQLLTLGLIDGAGSSATPPAGSSGGFAGGDRAWYRWKGNSYYLNHWELSQLLAHEEKERKFLKVKKKKKERTVTPEVWAQIMASIEKLGPIAEPEPYDDDEETFEFLMTAI